jgi:hypothetical protein
LQTREQQSESDVQNEPAGPQQLHVVWPACCRHCEIVPSGRWHWLVHGTDWPAHESPQGLGQSCGSQVVPAGHGWFAEHGTFEHAPLSMQNPHVHAWVAGSQSAFGTVTQFAGHGLLLSKHCEPDEVVHWQHTGGGMQSHFPGPVCRHWDPGGALGGHGPTQPLTVGDESKWQMMVVVVVLVVVLVVVVVVVVLCPTTIFSAGAQISFGLPTGTFSSCPNWSRRLTWMPFAAAARVAHAGLVQVFALIL